MIERAAAALLAHRGLGFYTDPMEGGQDAYDLSCQAMDEVRVVIEAMREPTDEMVKAGIDQYYRETGEAYPFDKRIRRCLSVMIDAALAKATPAEGGN